MNPAGLAMIEADNLDMIKDQSIIDLITPNYQRAFKKLANEVFKGNSGQLQFEIKGLKGTKKWLETHAVPFKDIDGNIISLLGVTRDISERKKAEEDLINNELLFRRLASNAPVGIFQTDKEGSCNYVNEEWLLYADMSFDEAMGLGFANAFHPDDKDRVVNEWQQYVLKGNEFATEFRFKSKEKITWVSVKAVGLYDVNNELYGYIGMTLDITERKKTEELLKDNKTYLDNIINNIGDPLFVKDEQSRFILANNAFYKLFNRTKEEILGKTFAENVSQEQREKYLNIDNKVISKGIESIDEDSINTEGEETRYISTKKTRFIDKNGKKYLIGTIRDITKQKQTEALLIESKTYLDNIINNIGDPVFVKDGNSQMILVNDALCSIFNLSREEIIGKTLAENVPPKERESFLRIDKEVLLSGIENVNEETLSLDKRETRTISTKKTRFIDDNGNKFLIGTIRDITKKKKAENEIKVSNERFEMISRATNDVVWDWDLIANKVGWNEKYYSHFGYPKKGDLLDVDSWYDGLHPDDKDRVVKGIHHAIEKRQQYWADEYRFLKADGTPVYILDRGYILYDNDYTPFRMVGAMLDITKLKKIEIELENHRNNLEELVELRTSELEKEKVKAQSADLMKSAFLATMSHELRTPMNSIIGFTGILLKEFAGPLNEEQKKQLSMVKTSSQHLLGLINDVLDISKIEAGKLKVSLYPFNYLTTLEKTIDFLLPQASKKRLIINSEISEMDITLISDERRVEQVLLNLISNAIKFSNKGTIKVKVDVIDNLLVTQIIDQGIGISEKDINKLFMPFIQLDDGGLSRTHEGTGLGLAICKSLIEKLGGTIQVQSKIGKGSNFTFTLPFDTANNKQLKKK
jgi:PAS domain S-box-containing protein